QVSKMGFDVFPITVIEETLESLGLRLDFFDSIGMQSHSDHEKIITHHLKNLKNNKVDVIVTSLSKVEQYLKTQEFPVYKVELSTTIIKNSIYDMEKIIKTKTSQLSALVTMVIVIEYLNLSTVP